MPRAKRTSPALEKAKTRAAGLRSIDAKLDLGKGLTLEAFDKAVATTDAALSGYNTALSQVDAANNELIKQEKALGDLSERMLSGVASLFGKDSTEYEKAGAVRKSERKKPGRKPKA